VPGTAASAGREKGVFKPSDQVADRSHVNAGLTMRQACQLVIVPSDSNTLNAATSHGVFKTTHGGALWALIPGRTLTRSSWGLDGIGPDIHIH